MNATEAQEILRQTTGTDPDLAVAQGLAWALHDVPYEHGLEAAQRAVKSGRVDATAIRRQLTAMPSRIAQDVRSAKLRHLIPADWPDHTPLPIDIERRLRAIQAATYEQTNDADQDAIQTPPRRGISR